ncbi:Transcription elongation factor S-II [Zancudomyces culisetae]|uniref:Transcription elongation factor S-II n=1 Tax=Zancudomyces culisetae TaxID=1213189 RepID=A0A1R1PIN2_ZANCU|nr:Transcription elongation factor S-II [Zancudomyces culisetae]|eukprot:OMH80816.1 Transcription elongation factor S-II [Zancudomyces culisetae]
MSSNKRKKDEKPVKKVKDSENGNKEKIELENRKRLKPQDEQEGKKEVETKQQEDESQSKKAKLETNGSKTEERTFDSDSVKIKSTENKMRDNGIKMLYNALVTDSDIDSEIAIQKAIEIESKEFEKNKANEKDKKNPALRENILCGDLSTDRFVNMTTQEMASEERKLADIQINSENMFRARGATPKEAETDQFKCGKCKKRRTTYFQMQTRSADEPMTTFVTCLFKAVYQNFDTLNNDICLWDISVSRRNPFNLIKHLKPTYYFSKDCMFSI